MSCYDWVMAVDRNETKPDSQGAQSVLRRLLELEGLLRETYRELGGAERAIREEREGYSR